MRAALVMRRARRDSVLLIVIAVLVGLAVALAALLPRLVSQVVDTGARAAVAAAGTDADIVVRTLVGRAPEGTAPAASVDQLDDLAAALPDRLPGVLHGVVSTASVTISSADAAGIVDDGATKPTRIAVQFGALGDSQKAALDLVAGRLPTDAGRGVEVVVSRQAAERASLDVGEAITVGGAATDATVVVTIVGIVSSADEHARAWVDLRRMWEPATSSASVPGSGAGIVALASPASLTRVQPVLLDTFAATVRLPLVPAAFTADRVERVAAAVRGLDLHSSDLADDFPAQVSARSDFEDALGDFTERARAAIAQSSLLVAGVLGVAVVVLAQLGRLLALRRSPDLALERARGAALPTIAFGALAESVPLVLIGSVAGLLIARAPALTPATLAVMVIAAVAPPLQAVLIARAAWRARRVAANRVDRRAVERAQTVRRLALEVIVIVLAIAAIAAIRTRGLLQGATSGIDPLLAASPLLLATAVAIVLLRAYPFVVRGAAALARRSTGAVGVLGAAQAQRALAPLPVLALTLACALVVGGGLLIDTVTAGQRDASWVSVGADARVTAAEATAGTDDLGTQPGVIAAGSFRALSSIGLTGGPSTSFVTAVAVDPGYADVVAALGGTPAAGDAGDAGRLRSLATASDSDRLPVLVAPDLADRLADSRELVITVDGSNVRVEVVGEVATGPGYLSGPFLYIDRADLAERLGEPVTADTTLLVGPGAGRAAASVDGGTVLTRTGWIADQRGDALVAGVNRVMVVSTMSVALFAAIALLAGVLAGSRGRARSLALLRTLGMQSRSGWWLAAAETAPVVVAALVGGIAAGVGIVLVLGPSLGLAVLAGSSREPAPSLAPGVVVAVAGAAIALSVLAVAAEVATHRRERLNDVLRVGETI